MKYKRFLTFCSPRSRRAFLGILSFFTAILLPFSFVNAGILSFMDGIFDDLYFSKELFGVSANSQTMPLLQAARNSDPTAGSESSDVMMVDDSAVLARATPDTSDGNTFFGSISASDQISVYVVRKGDTLSAIAKMFGVSANTVLWANDIPRGGSIKVGQKLVILPVSGVQHTIKKGDTVAKVAVLYKADSSEIRALNDLEEDEKLTVGDMLIIPNGVEPEVPAPSINKKPKIYTPVNSSLVATDGYFFRPASSAKTQGIHGHNGVDFSGRGNPEVYAAAAGTVIISRSSGWNGGYGHYIVIKHNNGTQTLYAHLGANFVAEGAEVSQGQRIGTIGATGKSFGPHLHFEVRGGRNPF